MGLFDKVKQGVSDLSANNSDFDVQYTVPISFIAGEQLVGATGLLMKQMMQLSDGRIIFNTKEPVYFELLSIDFDGARYHEEISENSKDNSQTKTVENSKTKKKRHSLGGAVLGTVLLPGVGTAIGALAGSKSGKDKTHKQGNSKTEGTSSSLTKTQQIEDDSSTTLELNNITSNQVVKVVLRTKTADYQKLLSFQLKAKAPVEKAADPLSNPFSNEKSPVEQIKEFKELLDSGIITQEEFDQKKKELLGL